MSGHGSYDTNIREFGCNFNVFYRSALFVIPLAYFKIRFVTALGPSTILDTGSGMWGTTSLHTCIKNNEQPLTKLFGCYLNLLVLIT